FVGGEQVRRFVLVKGGGKLGNLRFQPFLVQGDFAGIVGGDQGSDLERQRLPRQAYGNGHVLGGLLEEGSVVEAAVRRGDNRGNIAVVVGELHAQTKRRIHRHLGAGEKAGEH